MADLAERYSLRRDCASATRRTSCCRMSKQDDLFAALAGARRGRPCRRRTIGLVTRHHRLPGPRLLRAGQRALDPDRAGDLAQRFADLDAPGRDRRAEDQDLRLHQCLRPPPCRPHRHPRRRQEGRGILPDHARRLRRRERLDRHHPRPGLCRPRGGRRHREDRRDLSEAARSRARNSSPPIAALARKPFKEALYAAA